MKIGKRHIILNHCPLLAFSGAWRGIDATYQLFGHVHTSPYTDEGLDQQRMKYLFTTQYDVGVDNNNFTPASFRAGRWNECNERYKFEDLLQKDWKINSQLTDDERKYYIKLQNDNLHECAMEYLNK